MKIARRRDSKLPGIRILRKLYVTDELTLKQIGDMYGSSAATVLYHLKKYSVPIRDRSESSKLAYKKGRRTPTGSGASAVVIKNGTIVCNRCQISKPVSNFRKRHGAHKNLYNGYCLECVKIRSELRKMRAEMYERGMSLCNKCEEWKTFDNFAYDDNRKTKMASKCRRCASNNVEYHDYLEERKELLALGKKYCPSCNRTKNLSCFNRHTRSTDGYASCCKLCSGKINAKYKENNQEELRRRFKEEKPWRRKKAKEQATAWRRANKDKVNAGTRRRRAAMRASGGEYSEAQWKALIKFYCPERRCICCKKKSRLLTPDHIIPIVKGGTSWITNIQPMCFRCNKEKFTDTIDYRFDGGEYAEKLMEIS